MNAHERGVQAAIEVYDKTYINVNDYRQVVEEILKAYFSDGDLLAVPYAPTSKMLKAAAKSMSYQIREDAAWVSVKEKHRIRYKAMLEAWREEKKKLQMEASE